MENSNHGHRQRLRNKFFKFGGDSMYDYEKVELLLTYCIPRRDVKPLAKILLAHFGSLKNLFDASPDELQKIPGISDISCAMIVMAGKLFKEALNETPKYYEEITNNNDIADFIRMKTSSNLSECFILLLLNLRHEIIKYEFFPDITLTSADDFIEKIIKSAIKYNINNIIAVHYTEDKEIFLTQTEKSFVEKIKTALAHSDFNMLDYIIINKYEHLSIKAVKTPNNKTENIR